MSFENDDELLATLGRAIGPDPDAAPSDAAVAALRALVIGHRDGAAAEADGDDAADDVRPVVLAMPIPIDRAPRWRRRALAGGLAAAVVLSGATAVAAAVNDGALPSPVRYVVHAVGIPVDSIALADAKDALRRLRTATDAELPAALDRAERAVAALAGTDRAALIDDAERTLAEGRERQAKLQASASGGDDRSDDGATPSAPSATPTGTTTATTVDDHGGSRGSDDGGPSGTPGTSGGGDHSGGSSGSDDRSSVASNPGGSGDDQGGGGHGSDDGAGTSSPTGTTATGGGGHGGDDAGAPAATSTPASPTAPATTAPATASTDDGGGSGGGKGKGGGSGG